MGPDFYRSVKETFLNKNVSLILGKRQNFGGQVKKATFQSEILDWGPRTIWNNMTSVQFFFSKITRP